MELTQENLNQMGHNRKRAMERDAYLRNLKKQVPEIETDKETEQAIENALYALSIGETLEYIGEDSKESVMLKRTDYLPKNNRYSLVRREYKYNPTIGVWSDNGDKYITIDDLCNVIRSSLAREITVKNAAVTALRSDYVLPLNSRGNEIKGHEIKGQ